MTTTVPAAAARLGAQYPTQSIVLPYESSHGAEAVALYEQSGRTALPWQQLQIEHLLAVDAEGLYVHQLYGYEVPRQNGKGEILLMLEFYCLVHGERICHTAHKTSTSHSAWKKLCDLLTACGYKEIGRSKKGEEPPEKSFKAPKQYGLEEIRMTNGGTAVFRTRTEAGGIGESFDLLVIDEAQEYTSGQQGALTYTIAASPNPHTVLVGTPPTPQSKGDVFRTYRQQCLAGAGYDSGWAEWSTYDKPEDYSDPELWYKVNPSLGYVLRERTIRTELTGSDDLDFLIQRLGYWHSYELKSEISEAEWLSLKCKQLPAIKGKLYAGIKFGADVVNCSLSVAVKTNDGKIFLETIDCQAQTRGLEWVLRFLKAADLRSVAIDGRGKAELLLQEIETSKIKVHALMPTTAEAITAYAAFRSGIDSETITHAGQPSVTQAVSHCEKRLIGTNGAFGFKSMQAGIDVSIVESLALAYWLASTAKERRKQRITY